MALRRALVCFFFPLWNHFSFYCVCLTLNLMSKSEAGWELITQASHYSLPGIKYAACPWTWYSLSLCFYFRVSAWSFFFFCLKVNILTSPLSPPHLSTPRLTISVTFQKQTLWYRHRRWASEQRLNFSPRLRFFFFCCQLWCTQPSRPYHLAPSPPVCVFTPKGRGVCSLVTGRVKCLCRRRCFRGTLQTTDSESSLPLWCITVLLFITSVKQHGC